jgi:branched-chain amino acid transport system permease protein
VSSRGAEERRSAAPKSAPSLETSLRARDGTPALKQILVAAMVGTGLLGIAWLGPSYRFLSMLISTEIAAITLYGLSILFGQGGMLSLAHAALMGVGAYTAAILAARLGLGFWPAVPFAMAASGVVAGLLGLSSLRVAGHQFIIITFAFGSLFSIVLTNGGEFTGAATGLDVGPVTPMFGVNFNEIHNYYVLVTIILLLSILTAYLVSVSRYGRILRSIRENEALARAVGINTGLHKLGAFMLSGLFAALAGVLQAYFLQHISPTLYGGFPSVYLALMVMLGGPRLLYGPLVGAIIVNFLPEVMNLDPIDARIAYGIGLIAVIMLLPGGVMAGLIDAGGWLLTRFLRRGSTLA